MPERSRGYTAPAVLVVLGGLVAVLLRGATAGRAASGRSAAGSSPDVAAAVHNLLASAAGGGASGWSPPLAGPPESAGTPPGQPPAAPLPAPPLPPHPPRAEGPGWEAARSYAAAAEERCGRLPSAAGLADFTTFVSEVCAALRCWCRHRRSLREYGPAWRRGRRPPPQQLAENDTDEAESSAAVAAAAASEGAAASAAPGSRRLLKRTKIKIVPACPTRPDLRGNKFPPWKEGKGFSWPRNTAPGCSTCSSPLLAVLEMELPPVEGLWMQFGVFRGNSLNPIAHAYAARNGTGEVFGFDTFGPGLPQGWMAGFGTGAFSISKETLHGKVLACMPRNAHPIKGLFDVTLPHFLRQYSGHAALIDIDCDLYQGARDALTLLSPRITPGTLIHFDELVGYKGYREHEVKALWEWVRASGRSVVPAAWFGNGLADGGCGTLSCTPGNDSNYAALDNFGYAAWDKRRLDRGKFPAAAAFVVA
eukprot:TRINITY_DN37280_c0_g1_i2.p1 TRINITY_DN37280_c0_g1~~TRINITY_DN37280_c0_g1_i2.p1  ORF type:complete len:504 (+),score=114.33 TRINITY_DN37280_c0_g1_i2:80-1513(+)